MTSRSTGTTRPAPVVERSAADTVRSPREWAERCAVLTAARLAEHPLVLPVADVALRTQILATRLNRRATMWVWHTCGVATFDEMNVLGERLASLRHRLPATLVDAKGDQR